MADLVFSEACLSDARDLAPRLREADRRELQAAHNRHMTLQGILERSIAGSSLCWAAEEDGRVVMLFGVAGLSLLSGVPRAGSVGVPWMVGSDELRHHGKTLVSRGRYYVGKMHEEYAFLMNHVDARNSPSKRWLRRIGFVLYPAEPYGPKGLPFHRFVRKAACVA